MVLIILCKPNPSVLALEDLHVLKHRNTILAKLLGFLSSTPIKFQTLNVHMHKTGVLSPPLVHFLVHQFFQNTKSIEQVWGCEYNVYILCVEPFWIL